MSQDTIVQFVSFETTLDREEFITKWQEYTRSNNSDRNVTMQQSAKENGFRYLVQHRCATGGPGFVFEKGKRSSRTPEIGITTKLAGGYSYLQSKRKNDINANECKVFAFLTSPSADLDVFRQLDANSQLNIYEAYYENCRYAYILEFFVKNKNAAELLDSLKKIDVAETGIYKECALQLL
jgi:hypothetical protein